MAIPIHEVKQNTSIFVAGSTVHFSLRGAARQMKCQLHALQKRVKRGTVRYVLVNERPMIPDFEIALYRSKGRPIKGWLVKIEYPGSEVKEIAFQIWRPESLADLFKNIDKGQKCTVEGIELPQDQILHGEDSWPALPTNKVIEYFTNKHCLVCAYPLSQDDDTRKISAITFPLVGGLPIAHPQLWPESKWEDFKKLVPKKFSLFWNFLELPDSTAKFYEESIGVVGSRLPATKKK